jgi:ABC-type branched-subunit amino acid transport system ATPase component
MMLEISDLSGGYSDRPVLQSLCMSIPQGSVICLLGANGAGKTSTLRAISGALPHCSGSIKFEGNELLGLAAHKRAHLGIAHVPEGRRVFGTLSVKDNLFLGGITAKTHSSAEEELYTLFPRLKERREQIAGTLSGGEQQMLAIGRAMMSNPRLLILDEPSMGLAPKIVDEVFSSLQYLKNKGLTLLLVEQYAKRALEMSTFAYVLNQGKIAMQGKASHVLSNLDQLHNHYLS